MRLRAEGIGPERLNSGAIRPVDVSVTRVRQLEGGKCGDADGTLPSEVAHWSGSAAGTAALAYTPPALRPDIRRRIVPTAAS